MSLRCGYLAQTEEKDLKLPVIYHSVRALIKLFYSVQYCNKKKFENKHTEQKQRTHERSRKNETTMLEKETET